MSVVLPTAATPLAPAHGAAAGLRHLIAAWRSVRWYELAGFLALGLLYGVVDLAALADVKHLEHPWALFWRLLLSPPICTVVLLLAWLPADRSDPGHRLRSKRLMLAAALGSLISVPLLWGIGDLAGWPTWQDLCTEPSCKAPLSIKQRFAADFLYTLLPSSLSLALIEMLRRRWRSEAMLQSLLNEQAALGRQAMAARLAAMQAQVEPHFLFEVLVDVQQQYALGQGEAAAEQLERLIHHLRVALPRLRDQNVTTLDAEAALLGSYLSLRRGLERRPVEFDDRLPATLRCAALPAMLLLPLLQRALRLAPGGLPQRIELTAWRHVGTLGLRLTVSAPGLCGDDADLAAQRNRLHVLAGDAARLHCEEDAHATRFTLELPT
ncbi:histidine kinase [Ideonella sp.]|uniref:sensor histidine kinase n=1 Tax=Ideonella sp. TaxID=1929293 RepID=UPI002B47E06C|nr:histidine kinase [Ideonella sp.]HJV72451.1 histidine kinase [Ideonella sp.]